jgi:hypothetical protein
VNGTSTSAPFDVANEVLVQYVVMGIRCLIGCVFLVSSLSKTGGGRFEAFVSSLYGLRVLPPVKVRTVAVVVLVLEFSIWILFLVPARAAIIAAATLAAALLTILAGGIMLALRRGATQSCRCFGMSTAPLRRRHVARNALLAIIAVASIPGTVSAGVPNDSAGLLIAAVIGLLLGGLVTVLDDILGLFETASTRRVGRSGHPGHISHSRQKAK